MIDPALLRPGRLDTQLYVGLPDPAGRASILRTLVRNVPIRPDVDVGAIGESNRCEGFSGADLASLVTSLVLLLQLNTPKIIFLMLRVQDLYHMFCDQCI